MLQFMISSVSYKPLAKTSVWAHVKLQPSIPYYLFLLYIVSHSTAAIVLEAFPAFK